MLRCGISHNTFIISLPLTSSGTVKLGLPNLFFEVNMIVLAVASISLLIIIYLYIRSQSLHKELAAYRRQVNLLSSDVKHVEGVTEALVFEQQVSLQKTITRIKQFGHPENDLLKYGEIMIDALVKMTTETAKGHKNVTEAFKGYLGRSTDASYSEFQKFISSQGESTKTLWHKNSLVDYLTICQILVDKLSASESQ
ncbi:MAG: hypothetical protein ACI9FJ_001067 [Alteromonadaceae bacterium]